MAQSQPLLPYKIDTTKIVVEQDKKKKKVTYYLPTYVRFLIKQIDGVDQQKVQANVSGTLLISLYYGTLSDEIIDTFIGEDSTKSIVVEFNQDESIQLKQGKGITLKNDTKKRIVQYTIRKTFKTDIKGKLFLAPFITLNLYLLVILQSLTFKTKEQEVTIKFNCMDNKQILLLRHGQNLSFGLNQIAPYCFDVKYSNARKFPFQADDTIVDDTDVQDEQSLKYFQYAHFKIGIFQYPLNSLLKVFIPLWILGLMGLFVYFQELSFGARLATISVLALAYISLIDTINQSIPATPKLKLTEILILFQLIATILLLFQSFQNRDQVTFDFVWYQNAYFLASLAINILTFVTIVGLYIHHRCFQVPKYSNKNANDKYRKKEKGINRDVWRNKQCDKHFNHFAQKNDKKFQNLRQPEQ